jgi:hypothetical protein
MTPFQSGFQIVFERGYVLVMQPTDNSATTESTLSSSP